MGVVIFPRVQLVIILHECRGTTALSGLSLRNVCATNAIDPHRVTGIFSCSS